jgi:hypothetical protein
MSDYIKSTHSWSIDVRNMSCKYHTINMFLVISDDKYKLLLECYKDNMLVEKLLNDLNTYNITKAIYEFDRYKKYIRYDI